MEMIFHEKRKRLVRDSRICGTEMPPTALFGVTVVGTGVAVDTNGVDRLGLVDVLILLLLLPIKQSRFDSTVMASFSCLNVAGLLQLSLRQFASS